MIASPEPNNILKASEYLKQGKLIALPTETVYGLGADASNEEAIKTIFTAKGRPADHPLIVHLASQDQLAKWAINIPKEAYKLAEAFWPGPLTLILKRSSHVSDVVTGGQDTVGIRIPAHPVALELLRTFGGGVAAPSANKFGRISPTTAEHVAEELGNSISMILDGGACKVGLESTIIDLSQRKAQVLRPGGVGLVALTHTLGYEPDVKQKAAIRASGLLESHYAPGKPAFLLNQIPLSHTFAEEKVDVGIISFEPEPKGFEGIWIQLDRNAERYGQVLYSTLRQLDTSDVDIIYIEQVPDTKEWLAVRDRLKRATAESMKGQAK